MDCTSSVELGPPAAASSLAAEQAKSKVPACEDGKLAEEVECSLMHGDSSCIRNRSLQAMWESGGAHSIITSLRDLPARGEEVSDSVKKCEEACRSVKKHEGM